MKFLLVFITTILFGVGIVPIPDVKYNKQKALLGKKLFFDTILSKDKKVSCVSCHNFNEGGAENEQFSKGVFGRLDKPMNSQTVLNATFNMSFFWNGRATTLEQQTLMAIEDHNEFAMTPKEVEKRLNNNEKYKSLFQKVYNTNHITIKIVENSIAEFEKALTTPNSKFDLYLKGKITLSKDESKGYELFKRYGCIVCHNGVNVGSNSFQKIGVVIEDYNISRGLDRYTVTKDEDDKYVYKVPTLRNIALTAPYFHNGSVKTLQEAIQKMAYYNLGINLQDSEVKLIKIFLKTLTGNKPKILEEK